VRAAAPNPALSRPACGGGGAARLGQIWFGFAVVLSRVGGRLTPTLGGVCIKMVVILKQINYRKRDREMEFSDCAS